MGEMKRTHMCGAINEELLDERVTIMGWVQAKRDLKSQYFITIRDREGIVQVVFGEEINKDAYDKASEIKPEFCVAIEGKVVKRQSPNPQMPTGMVEILAEYVKIFSQSETPPIYIRENLDASEAIRLKYRYLDLRRPDMQRNLFIRNNAYKSVRDFFYDNGFIEIETPMLTKSTPEGARDYLVASRNYPGKFYALPQSPQIFKQLLMVSGYDKYYQIIRCFRDEDLRANRQPEFTQIDVEMSFVDIDDVISVNEKLIQKVFKDVKGVDVNIPFRRMTYKEAYEKYGSDKPDLRFGMEIKDVSDVFSKSEFKVFSDCLKNGGRISAIVLENGSSLGRKQIDKLVEVAKTFKAKGLAWISFGDEIKSSFVKFITKDEIENLKGAIGAKNGDLVLIVSDKKDIVLSSLGAIRLHLGRERNLYDKDEFNFVWITEFPLFEYSEEEDRYVAKHHPFTSPMDEDLDMIESDKKNVRAKAYDMVLNGEEIGGGSIRIYREDVQEKMFKALGFTMEEALEKFGFLLQAFKYGPPPHGGIAYGFDRIVMFLAETENIKDVIAFPKNQNAVCPLSEAPNLVSDKQLEELGISLIKEKNLIN